MFKKVKLQLTIINITVVGIILLLFFSGIYILMRQNTIRQSEQLLRAVAADFRKPDQRPDASLSPRRWSNIYFVKYNTEGVLINKSSDIPMTDEELASLLDKAFSGENDMGQVHAGSDTYRYYRSFPPDYREVTVVFHSTQSERETLTRLGTILVFVGITGLVIVFVSSLFMAEKALVPIKKSWDRQKNFVADASHELRSPLAVMQTSLELIMGNREETVDSQVKWLENMQLENKRMTKLVNDLLILARADSEQQLMEKYNFPLNETIGEAIASYEPVAAKKNIQLALLQNDPINFYGDENRLKQLAIILIDNAIKYTPSGGRAAVYLRKHDNQAELVVTDTGEGIEREHLRKIFDRFYRVDKSRSRESGGTGLGLSIADWIIKEHKGTISVSSTPGVGSTFKVQLPIITHK